MTKYFFYEYVCITSIMFAWTILIIESLEFAYTKINLKIYKW